MTQPQYFLGVDAGGTKTHALIANQFGQAVGFGSSGSGNWETIGLSGLTQTLQSCVLQALKVADLGLEQIAGVGMGLAGFDWPSQKEMILSAITPLGFNCPVEIVNDATLGIFAGTSLGWGVSVVSGTGCNCRGWDKNRRKEARMVGGNSEWSGEYAGGYDILMRAMRSVTFEWGKRGPATALSQVFMQKAGASNLDDLIEGLYTQKYRLDMTYLMLVFQLAAQGDPEALSALDWAGDQLGQMACGVIRQLALEDTAVEVVLIGSVFDGHARMTTSLRNSIHKVAPKAQLIRLKSPPVVGGVLLGMEQIFGLEAYNTRDNLLSSTSLLLSASQPVHKTPSLPNTPRSIFD